jgi:GNAT superfamily N-acetyltransferase
MNTFELRKMVNEDIDETAAVWERSRWDAQPWLEKRMNYSHEDNLQHFREVVARENEVWIACVGATIVGLMAIGSDQIDQLYVDPSYQTRGVGTALLDRAKALVPLGLSLFTHQRNEKARAFYERRGFEAAEFGTSPPPESEPDVRYVWNPDRASDSTL